MSTYVSTYILWHVAPTIMIIVEAVLEDVTGLWPQPYILMCLLCELPLCVSPQWSIRSVISRSSRDFLCSDSNHKTDVNLLSGMGNQRMKDLDLYPFPTFNTFSEKVAQGVFLGHISAMHWLCVTVFQFVYFRQHLFFDTCHTSIVGICSCGCAGCRPRDNESWLVPDHYLIRSTLDIISFWFSLSCLYFLVLQAEVCVAIRIKLNAYCLTNVC